MLDRTELRRCFEATSNIGLIRIIADERGYTQEARELAKSQLCGRLKPGNRFSLDGVLKDELARLSSLAGKCHVCAKDDQIYSEYGFRMRRDAKVDWGSTILESGIGIALGAVIGVGALTIHSSYDVVRLSSRLCRGCATRVKPTPELHVSHPLYELCILAGYYLEE